MADDWVRSEAAEVALKRGTPLAHEVVALHDLPLEDALVGPGRDEQTSVGRGKAVREGHHVAEAPPHADLPAAAREAGGDEVGEVAPGARDHAASGTPAAGLRVLLRIGHGDFGEHRGRGVAARGGLAGDAGRRGGREVVLLEEVVDDEGVVVSGGVLGGRRSEERVGGGRRGGGGGRGRVEREGFEVVSRGGGGRRRLGCHHGCFAKVGRVWAGGGVGSDSGEGREETIGRWAEGGRRRRGGW